MVKQPKSRRGPMRSQNGAVIGASGRADADTSQRPPDNAAVRARRTRTPFRPAIYVTEPVDVLELIGRAPDDESPSESRDR